MIEYVHSVPGRLRLKLSSIENRPDAAEALRSAAASIDGVTSVSANPTTGSLIVHYQPERLSSLMLLAELERRGHFPVTGHIALTNVSSNRNGRSRRSDGLGPTVSEAIVGEILQQSARVLVRAFI